MNTQQLTYHFLLHVVAGLEIFTCFDSIVTANDSLEGGLSTSHFTEYKAFFRDFDWFLISKTEVNSCVMGRPVFILVSSVD
jgi:hypothetical protein